VDAHRVQWVLDLVRHAGGEPTERRELLRIGHQRLDRPDRIQISNCEHGAAGPLAAGDSITRHRQLARLPIAERDLHRRVPPLDPALEELGDEGRQGMVGRLERLGRLGERRVDPFAEQRLCRLVAEHHLLPGVQHDDRVLEAVEDSVDLAGLNALAQLVDPGGQRAQLVVTRQLDGAGLAAPQPLHAARESLEPPQEHVTRPEADDEDHAERDDRQKQAAQRGARQLLPEQARRHADPHGAERLVAQAHRHLSLVNVRPLQERGHGAQSPPRLDLVEALLGRKKLAVELRVAVSEDAIRRVDDGGIDHGVRVADDALEHRANPRIALDERRVGLR
jgi:hypothetical protein